MEQIVTVPLETSKKFFQAYNNHFNYFSYERVYQGQTYHPKPSSMLLSLPRWVPTFLERPLLFCMYIPKLF